MKEKITLKKKNFQIKKKKPFSKQVRNFNKIRKEKRLKIIKFKLNDKNNWTNKFFFCNYLNFLNIKKWNKQLNKKNLNDYFYFFKVSSDNYKNNNLKHKKNKYNKLILNYPNNIYSINNNFISKIKKNYFLKKSYKNKINNHTSKFINYNLKKGKFQKIFNNFLKSIILLKNNLTKKLRNKNIFLIIQNILKIINVEIYYSTLNKGKNKKWLSLKLLNRKKSYNLGIKLFLFIALNNNQEKTYKLKIMKEFVNIINGKSSVIKEKIILYKLIKDNINLWTRKNQKKKWYYSTKKKQTNSLKKKNAYYL